MLYIFVFFFFKQKTAYEMRISDWSSDVCSSDLFFTHRKERRNLLRHALFRRLDRQLRQQLIQHLLELPLSTCRAQIGNGLPLENGIDSRDGLNPELTGNEAIFIDIDFDQLHALIGIIRGDLFDNGTKLLAGAAPSIGRASCRE